MRGLNIENPTVLGYMKSQSAVLKYVYDHRKDYTEPFIQFFKRNEIKKILFFGSGTSYNVSQLAAYYFKHLVNIEAEAHYPTVYLNYEQANRTQLLKDNQILCVGISQSGTSISTIEMMKEAKKRGHLTMAFTSNPESKITQHVDLVTEMLVGPEEVPPETKGFTASLLSVYLFSLALSKELNIVTEKEYCHQLSELERLIQHYEQFLADSEAWYDRNRTTIINSRSIVILGYGIDYGSALEGQLKIGEMLRYPTLAYELEEYIHGGNAALKEDTTVLIIGSEEKEFERMLQIRSAVKQHTDRVHVISFSTAINDVSALDLIFDGGFDKTIAPLVYALPMQFIAAKGAAEVGIDTRIWPFKVSLGHLPKQGAN